MAVKLPNSDLKFALDFCVVFSTCVFQGERPEKSTKKKPQNSLGTLFG